jgi:hypothetical protein
MLTRLRQFVKQDQAIVFIDDEIEIDSSDEHASNADSPRVAILESGSNLTLEMHSHLLKEDFEIVSIDEGREID